MKTAPIQHKSAETLIDCAQVMNEMDELVELLYSCSLDRDGRQTVQTAYTHALSLASQSRKRVTELLMGAR